MLLAFIGGVEPFHLLAVPMFIVAGEIMVAGGVGIRDNGAGLPARYALPKASGLTVDVREGMNVLDFAF